MWDLQLQKFFGMLYVRLNSITSPKGGIDVNDKTSGSISDTFFTAV